VSIPDIRVSKICQAPLQGPIFVGQGRLSGSGPVGGTQLGINLDSPNPEVMVAPGWDVSKWRREYASGPPVIIPAGGTHEFPIRAIALHHACEFWIVLVVVDGDKVRRQTFSDDGQPFRVSALLPGVLKRQKPGGHPYVGYPRLYVGGSASPWRDGSWVRENPGRWIVARRPYDDPPS